MDGSLGLLQLGPVARARRHVAPVRSCLHGSPDTPAEGAVAEQADLGVPLCLKRYIAREIFHTRPPLTSLTSRPAASTPAITITCGTGPFSAIRPRASIYRNVPGSLKTLCATASM